MRQNLPKSRFIGVSILLLSVAVVAIASCLIVYFAFLQPNGTQPAHAHSFLHELDLSEEEKQRVQVIDQRFEAKRQEILREFRLSTARLAELLGKETHFSEAIHEAIEEIHHFHGQLQALSIQRYFALLEDLSPTNQAKLRELASRTLSHPE